VKWIIKWVMAGFFIILALVSCTPKAPLQKIVIGTDATFPPFEMLNSDKRQITGFDIDLMNAIAAKARLEVTFAPMGYDQLLNEIAQCQVDGAISAISISDDLKQQMDFSEPYFAVGQVVVVKSGNALISSREDLGGLAVGIQANSASAREVASIPGVQMKTYPSFSLAYQDLINGMLDAVISDKILALSYTGQPANNLQIVGDEFAVENLAIAMCKNKPDLLKKINDGLAAVTSSGAYDKLVQKWLKNPVVN
jgi:ABC-type amino acid transport substrate-binding protein